MIERIENLYIKYGPMVLRRCRALLKDEQKAVDAMQDTFVNLLKNKSRLEDKAISSLLYRIATNICLNIIRDNKKYRCGDNEQVIIKSMETKEDGNIENKAVTKDLLKCLLSKEDEKTAYIVVLFYLDEMTLEELAVEVSMSVSGVRKRLKSFSDKIKRFKERGLDEV